MGTNELKKLKLVENGKLIDIAVDFGNNVMIRESDRMLAKINSVKGNVIKVAGRAANEEYVIVFDDKFALMGRIDFQNMYYHQPLGIWVAPKSQVIYFEIAKNACTSITTALYESNWKKWWTPRITERRSIWDVTTWNKSYLYKKYNIGGRYWGEKNKYEDYRKIMIYDDPVKRFIRALNNKYINHHTIASNIRPPYDKNIHDFIDKVILATQLDCLNNSRWDQHLAPITLNAASYLDEITDFCHLSDLDEFMFEKFNIRVRRHNSMPKEKKRITEEVFLPYQLERIKQIYAQDYKIPVIYKDKFYRNSN